MIWALIGEKIGADLRLAIHMLPVLFPIYAVGAYLIWRGMRK